MQKQDEQNLKDGILITFEGDDGVGKTTHINFLADTLADRGLEVVSLREPGGTAIGESLRNLVLDTEHENMSAQTELLIYEAARAQLVDEIIKPALERGAVVLCDRFYDSSVAYQGFGRGLDLLFINEANAFATDGVIPNRTFLMTRSNSGDGLKHILSEEIPDRLELAGMEFHDRVRAGFQELASTQPKRIVRIDASGDRADTAEAIFAALVDLFPWMSDDSLYNREYFSRLDKDHAARVAARAAKLED